MNGIMRSSINIFVHPQFSVVRPLLDLMFSRYGGLSIFMTESFQT